MLNIFANRNLPKKIRKGDLQTEKSTSDSSYFSDYIDILNGYNPDALVSKKGLEIFDDMSRDEQVKAAYQTKVHAILSTGYDVFEPAPKYKKQTEFAKLSITDWLEGSFDDVITELLSFLKYGFVVAEQNYEYEDASVYLKNIKVRAPHTFEFHPDEYGNLPIDTGLQQHQGSGGLIPLPLNKFIIHSYRMEFSNYYGKSDLIEAYRPWFIKDQLVKYEAIYLEKYAIPPILAKYENMNQAQRSQLMKVLQTMRGSSVAALPKTVEVEIINAIANGGMHFRKAIEAQDNAISKAILMPNQLGYNDTGSVGSNAKAQTQFDVFLWTVENIRKTIAESIINEQIIKPLIYYNFGEQEEYPYFQFNPMTEKNKDSIYKLWFEAVKAQIVKPTVEDEKQIRKELEMPERDEDTELLNPVAEGTEVDAEGNPIPPKVDAKGKPIEEDIEDEDIDDEDMDEEDVKDTKKKKKDNKAFAGSKFPMVKNMERTDFKKIDNIYQTSQDLLVKDLENIIDDIAVEAIDRIQNKKIITNKRFDEIDKFKLKYVGDLKLAFKKMSKEVYQAGITTWKQEQPNKKFADQSEIMPDEYLEWLNSKAFMEAGKISDAYLIQVKQQLIYGIENGWSEKKIISNLDQMFNTVLVAGATVKPIFTTADLQLIARMNINASFNKARYINALGLSQSVKEPVYALYSEILEGKDNVSHPFSAFIHGKYVLMGTELAQRLQYPLHYNDRGVMVTVDSSYAKIPEDMVLKEMPDLSKYSGLTIA